MAPTLGDPARLCDDFGGCPLWVMIVHFVAYPLPHTGWLSVIHGYNPFPGWGAQAQRLYSVLLTLPEIPEQTRSITTTPTLGESFKPPLTHGHPGKPYRKVPRLLKLQLRTPTLVRPRDLPKATQNKRESPETQSESPWPLIGASPLAYRS